MTGGRIAVWSAIAALGAVGALGRYGVDAMIRSRRRRSGFPHGTMVVNLSGSFAVGLLTGLAIGGDTLLLLGVAAVGSFTTFSTWIVETHRLAEAGRTAHAVANVVLSTAAGLAVLALGWSIGGMI